MAYKGVKREVPMEIASGVSVNGPRRTLSIRALRDGHYDEQVSISLDPDQVMTLLTGGVVRTTAEHMTRVEE